MIILRKEAKRIGGRKMRAYIQDNGIEKDLKKGTLGEVKEYLVSNLIKNKSTFFPVFN